MKNRYMRVAYYLNKKTLLRGTKDKQTLFSSYTRALMRVFATKDKKDIGKTLFCSFSNALESVSELEIAGLTLNFGIDVGMALTRIFCLEKGVDEGQGINQFYRTETLVPSENAAPPVFFRVSAVTWN